MSTGVCQRDDSFPFFLFLDYCYFQEGKENEIKNTVAVDRDTPYRDHYLHTPARSPVDSNLLLVEVELKKRKINAKMICNQM